VYPGLEFPLPRYYDWSDQSYRDFMMEILRCLNPRREESGYLLMDELEECLEIFFLMKGTVGVGFEINKIRHFGLKYTDTCVIGGFNCTFYQRSMYIWKCLAACEGFFMYKRDWLRILDEQPVVGRTLKSNVLMHYIIKVRRHLEAAKRDAFATIVGRAHHQNVCVVETKDVQFIQKIQEDEDEKEEERHIDVGSLITKYDRFNEIGLKASRERITRLIEATDKKDHELLRLFDDNILLESVLTPD
jgi:hypothetical protein